MDGQALPNRATSFTDSQSAADCSCLYCGIPMISGALLAAKPLCAYCRSQILADISRRSAEIRSCIGVLQTSLSPSDTEYETAKQHLQVLAEYERQRILSTSPSAVVMAQRLETLRSEHRAKIAARSVDREIRDDRPLVDWVGFGDSARLTRQRSSPCPGRPQTDRRAEPRQRTSFSVLVQPLGVTAVATDVSRGGIHLRCRAHRSAGSPVRLVLRAPGGPITAQGVVRRVEKPNRGLATETIGLAIQFTRTPPAFSLDLLG